MSFVIRTFREDDRAQWDVLWRGYLEFYETSIPDEVSEIIWRHLLDPEEAILGFCADDGGKLLGIVHYLFHPVTWAAGPRCYLEDLFTTAEARGRGVGRALIEAVYKAADEQGADQVYWLTRTNNATARRLYDRLAKATDFIKYRR
ncbi:MAG TPA: GNAT family N-acetyltransferase [Hyphomonadaceae bacterium]|jgi:ribosomal protein S18 acetylase RimI-like enzyme|nr:GNAT family N-acetyltransferase [Hyphomonadaceae bacterium]